MNHTDTNDHGQLLQLARSNVGHVSTCACGVVTVTLHYMSLRFEPDAFRELVGMLNFAQYRIESGSAVETAPPSTLPTDTPPVH